MAYSGQYLGCGVGVGDPACAHTRPTHQHTHTPTHERERIGDRRQAAVLLQRQQRPDHERQGRDPSPGRLSRWLARNRYVRVCGLSFFVCGFALPCVCGWVWVFVCFARVFFCVGSERGSLVIIHTLRAQHPWMCAHTHALHVMTSIPTTCSPLCRLSFPLANVFRVRPGCRDDGEH